MKCLEAIPPRPLLTAEQWRAGMWRCNICGKESKQLDTIDGLGITPGVPVKIHSEVAGIYHLRLYCLDCGEAEYRRREGKARCKARRQAYVRFTRAWRAVVAVAALMAGAGLLLCGAWRWW